MKKNEVKKNTPVTIVLFGATGDLALKKIFPALSLLWKENSISSPSRVIAVSRRPWSDSDMRRFLIENSEVELDLGFLEHIYYSEVDFEKNKGFDSLAKRVKELDSAYGDTEKLLYISLAPKFYVPVIKGLKQEKILSRGSTKILIEKPFGTSAKTAKALDKLLLSFLSHEQIYRMDHYLGKETIQTIMKMHEETRALGTIISNETTKFIRIRLFEMQGINGRGASYDSVGAFRDVGQNHMMEILAVIATEPPENDSATSWHNARANVIESLIPPTKTCEQSRRGQYVGYQNEKGIVPGSETETAFELVTGFNSGELKGIPVILESGKMMRNDEVVAIIGFKEDSGLPKEIEFRIQPDRKMIIRNLDGTEEVIEISKFRDAYSNVIKDALCGVRRHFVGSKEIEAAWRYADKVVDCWSKVPIENYSENKPFAPGHNFW